MKKLGCNSYDFHETYTIPGYEDFLLACKDKDDVPRWLSARAYAGCSLLCCTIPYRIMFALVSWEIPKYRYAPTCTPQNHGVFVCLSVCLYACMCGSVSCVWPLCLATHLLEPFDKRRVPDQVHQALLQPPNGTDSNPGFDPSSECNACEHDGCGRCGGCAS
jgi:hypothetical protein